VSEREGNMQKGLLGRLKMQECVQKKTQSSSGVGQQKTDYVFDMKSEGALSPWKGQGGGKSRKTGKESKHDYVKNRRTGNVYKRQQS